MFMNFQNFQCDFIKKPGLFKLTYIQHKEIKQNYTSRQQQKM